MLKFIVCYTKIESPESIFARIIPAKNLTVNCYNLIRRNRIIIALELYSFPNGEINQDCTIPLDSLVETNSVNEYRLESALNL